MRARRLWPKSGVSDFEEVWAEQAGVSPRIWTLQRRLYTAQCGRCGTYQHAVLAAISPADDGRRKSNASGLNVQLPRKAIIGNHRVDARVNRRDAIASRTAVNTYNLRRVNSTACNELCAAFT